MKKVKLIFCIFLMGYLLNSQNDLDNHKKYWFYKSRLQNDFMKVGLLHGESLTFNERSNSNSVPPYTNSEFMNTGDCTARLGLYLATLATEYRLLKNNGQDVSKVKYEIFCALNAINRLDFYAETALTPNAIGSLNGFFIRYDISKNFVKNNYQHFNYFNNGVDALGEPNTINLDRGFMQQDPVLSKGVSEVNTNFPFDADTEEESQDQVYYLLVGLTLTAKLVDANETNNNMPFPFESINVTSIVTESKRISERILNYMVNTNWVIKNPNTGASVARGPDARPYAYALDNLGDFIKNDEKLPFFYQSYITGPTAWPQTPSGNFRNGYSSGPVASNGWQAIGASGGGIAVDQQGFFHALAGTSNSIYQSVMLKNLLVQNAINAIQNQISNAQNLADQAIQNIINNIPSGAPQWIKNLANGAIQIIQNTLNILVNGLLSAITTLNTSLFFTGLVNTTDERLVYNTQSNQVLYFNDCLFPPAPTTINVLPAIFPPLTYTFPATPIIHNGSDLYFGTYVRHILFGSNQTLPNWVQFVVNPGNVGHLVLKNQVKAILNTAPCRGNFNLKSAPNGPSSNSGMPIDPQWGCSNFMDRPDGLWKKLTCVGISAEYSGVDYMLMHNLFYLVEGTTSTIKDFIDRTISSNLPIGGSFTSSNIGTIGAFENIKANNVLNSNAGVIYRAGKEIAFLPNFSASQGCDLTATIKNYTCSGTSDQMSRPSSGSNAGIDDDFDLLAYQPPIKQNLVGVTDDEETKENELNTFLNDLQNQVNHQMDSINKLVDNANNLIEAYNKVSVYPNPNTGKFFIEFKLSASENAEIEITDLIGKVVYHTKYIVGLIKLPIDLNGFAKGIYTIKIKFTNKRAEIRKITIE